MPEFLDFSEISRLISFKQVLNWLSIPFTEKKEELRANIGELLFIVNQSKNNFFCPKDQKIKGGIINFTSYVMNKDLREAAKALKDEFLLEPKPQKELPDLQLHYCDFLTLKGISKETAEKYEVGLVKQRSIVSGRIAFKIYDNDGKHIGYVGYSPSKKDWFFPKGFVRPLYNYHLFKDEPDILLTADPFKCLKLINDGEKCCSLIGKSMTESQEKLLITFSSVALIHSEPANIITRLYPHIFVKALQFKSNSAE